MRHTKPDRTRSRRAAHADGTSANILAEVLTDGATLREPGSAKLRDPIGLRQNFAEVASGAAVRANLPEQEPGRANLPTPITADMVAI